MKDISIIAMNLIEELEPENQLESNLLKEEEFVRGLLWGKPRRGHPEGQIYKHIKEITANIDKLALDSAIRRKLRWIAFFHDTFKHLEKESSSGVCPLHHGTYARRYAENFLQEEVLLKIIELHDEAYYSWRLKFVYKKAEEGDQRLADLLRSMGPWIQLYYLFFWCDTLTGNKTPAPLYWFEKNVEGIHLIRF